MFKYLSLIVIIAFWWQQIRGEVSVQNETKSEISPSPNNLTRRNNSEIAEEPNEKSVDTMNGNNNYHEGQQIFYSYRNQFLRLFDNNKGQESWLHILSSGYLITPGIGAHKLHPRKLTWNKARRACCEEGGHLAIINSQSEEKILLRLMQEQKIGEAYLGVHDIFQEGDWVTVLDQALESTGYTRWTTKYHPNEPDNYLGNQNCGLLVVEGGMDDIKCTDSYSYFCEISL